MPDAVGQRRAAESVDGIRVGTPLEQAHRSGREAIGNSLCEGAIDVGGDRGQRVDRMLATRRVVHRRYRREDRRLAPGISRVRVGARREQCAHIWTVAHLRGNEERRLSLACLPIDLRARRQHRVDDLWLRPERGDMERGLVEHVFAQVGVATCIE